MSVRARTALITASKVVGAVSDGGSMDIFGLP
jgi:hypothetical protein